MDQDKREFIIDRLVKLAEVADCCETSTGYFVAGIIRTVIALLIDDREELLIEFAGLCCNFCYKVIRKDFGNDFI